MDVSQFLNDFPRFTTLNSHPFITFTVFSNANVLFRTRFRDGTSIVERTAQRSINPNESMGGKENSSFAVARQSKAKSGARATGSATSALSSRNNEE